MDNICYRVVDKIDNTSFVDKIGNGRIVDKIDYVGIIFK